MKILWHHCLVKKDVTLGEKSFAAISAVEGLFLSEADQKQIAELKRKGLSNDEIRSALLAEFSARKAA
ncbi:MAG: hypothetical protein ACKVOJ_14325 [Sphingomonadaceae bacterium]